MRTLAQAGRMSTGGLWRTDVGTREVIGGKTLVPVAFSASHVAYSSLRMEPQT